PPQQSELRGAATLATPTPAEWCRRTRLRSRPRDRLPDPEPPSPTQHLMVARPAEWYRFQVLDRKHRVTRKPGGAPRAEGKLYSFRIPPVSLRRWPIPLRQQTKQDSASPGASYGHPTKIVRGAELTGPA